jgi:hypothetical protein
MRREGRAKRRLWLRRIVGVAAAMTQHRVALRWPTSAA